MCKKLKEIHGMQSKDIINKFIPDQKITTMEDLLNKMKIRCMGVDFFSLEKRMQMKNIDSIMCISYCDDANLNILYSQNLSKERLDYILAHEHAYCCLYFPVSAEYHITTKSESDLYMQNNFLYTFIKKIKIFLMKRRLIILQLLYSKICIQDCLIQQSNLSIQ